MIPATIDTQIKIDSGTEVKGANGKPLTSWRKETGEVSCKIGVLPLFVEGDKDTSVTFRMSKDEYTSFLTYLKESYSNGDMKDEVASLKRRKDAADKKAAESRKEGKKKPKMVLELDKNAGKDDDREGLE